MEIKSVFNSSFDDVDGVCIAVSWNIEHEQQHIGLLFVDEDGETKLLHLAWHYSLQKYFPDNSYLWLDIFIDPINKNKAKTLLLDSKDIVEFLGAGNSQVLIDARDVLNNNLSMLFNLPLSFFTGEFKSSLGSSNSSDIDYRDKGLINFYNSFYHK